MFDYLMFFVARGIGVSMIFPYFCIYIRLIRVGYVPVVLWYCFEGGRRAGNWLDLGIGIAFVVFGRCVLDGKPGVFPSRHEPYSQSLSSSPYREKSVFLESKHSTHVGSNVFLLNRQTYNKGYTFDT